jgi:hypothetical protein
MMQLEQVNPCLFTRGVSSDKFYLILSGGIQISSGSEGFILDYGKF